MTLALSISALFIVVSCGEDEEVAPNTQQNENPNSSNQVSDNIVVTIGADGKADGGHRFVKIDDTNFYIDDIKYTARNGDLVVSGYDKAFFKGEAKLITQLKYDGRNMTVVAIDQSSFNYCEVLTAISIPNSITRIGGYAFQGCKGLSSIQIPEFMTTIGSGAFSGCTGIKSLNIPQNLTSVGAGAFSGCTGIKSLNIPQNLTSVGASAFSYCTSINEVHISDLSSWLNIILNNDDIITKATYRLYLNDEEVKEIMIPSECSTIPSCAFNGCQSIESLVIPTSIHEIGAEACSGCSSLESINVPSSVNSIKSGAFANCPKLTSVTIESSALYFPKAQGWSSRLKEVFGPQVQEYHFSEDVNKIDDYACTLLEELKIVTIGSNVTSIGNYAFSYCQNLSSINIPNSVKSIGIGAFYGCWSIPSIIIPSSVTNIESNAFQGCGGLTSIIVEKNNRFYDSRNNCNAIIESKTNTLLRGCTNTTIPQGVTTIYKYAFSNSDIVNINIPEGVLEIGIDAFASCKDLQSITLPKSLEQIGYHIFSNCEGLTDVYCNAVTPPARVLSGDDVILGYGDGGELIVEESDYPAISKAVLHVPLNSIEEYKRTKPWSNYGSIVAIEE